jgi:hypothetical protein
MIVARTRVAPLVVVWLAYPWSAASAQHAELRYSARQLNCARFRETVDTDIQTETGGRTRLQTSGRSGVWQFRARPAVDAVDVESWLDSLAIWRQSPEVAIRPDTDGLLGGRYRGGLTGTGNYQSRTRPFVPDEIAEVADMASALSDFFPPLPPVALNPGKAWRGSGGVTIRRLADSGMSGVQLYRFELEVRREARTARVPNDTARLNLRQVTEERGTFVWHPLLGLLKRERRIVVTTSVPAGRLVRQTVRSRVRQRVTLLRDLDVPPDEAGRCGT